MVAYPARDEITWRDVESSNVARVGWDRDSNMYVKYRSPDHKLRGSLYRYDGVPRQRVIACIRASSVGRYINTKIKPFFIATKLY